MSYINLREHRKKKEEARNHTTGTNWLWEHQGSVHKVKKIRLRKHITRSPAREEGGYKILWAIAIVIRMDN